MPQVRRLVQTSLGISAVTKRPMSRRRSPALLRRELTQIANFGVVFGRNRLTARRGTFFSSRHIFSDSAAVEASPPLAKVPKSSATVTPTLAASIASIPLTSSRTTNTSAAALTTSPIASPTPSQPKDSAFRTSEPTVHGLSQDELSSASDAILSIERAELLLQKLDTEWQCAIQSSSRRATGKSHYSPRECPNRKILAHSKKKQNTIGFAVV